MADIEVVIKIDEETYKNIQFMKNVIWANGIYRAIHNGIPLPKGHGRLGDLDALQKEVSSWGMNDYEPSDFIDVINEADTIIEADTESKDKPKTGHCKDCKWRKVRERNDRTGKKTYDDNR